jgi:hypothetical protein
MHVDIYRRREPGNKYSYLLVPHGELVPDEVTNVDWEARQRGIAVDETAAHLAPYEIDQPRLQIEEKGYAITSVRHQVEASSQHAP